ncbi:MAG: DUF892 family protein [Candidatus Acidiferrales bacterium]
MILSGPGIAWLGLLSAASLCFAQDPPEAAQDVQAATYDCEEKLVNKGLPAMIESASSSELRSALEHHLGEIRGHVAALERVFAVLGAEANTKDNDIIDEMTKAAKDSAAHLEGGALVNSSFRSDNLRHAAVTRDFSSRTHPQALVFEFRRAELLAVSPQ